MNINACKIFWENDFLHYILFGFIGPFLAVLLIFAIQKSLKTKYWLKTSFIFILINFASCTLEREANIGCQIKLFGSVSDDPGDIGVILLTLPLFIICSLVCIFIIFQIKGKLNTYIRKCD